MTDEEFKRWLESDGNRTILVEVDTNTPRLLSSRAYTTDPYDTPPNTHYEPLVASGFAFSERLSLTGNPQISVGDIDLHNEDGALDAWFDEVWVNRAVRVYLGDITWPRGDFKLIFNGVIADLASSSRDRLNLVLRDKLQRLNTAVTETTLGGATTNKDRLLPITLGEVHNVEPLLIDPAEHQYQVHQGAMERIIEVRDNGVPLDNITATLSSGTFKLGNTPAGTITASVQGQTPYQNTVAKLVEALATKYGVVSERLQAGDIDSANLASFDLAHPQPVGVYIASRQNVLAVCQQLAASVGAQVVMSREGKLRLVKVDLPASGSPVKILPRNYELNSLHIKGRPEVVAGIKLGFCKSWLVQESLETGIPPEHKDLFSQEYLTVSNKDAVVAANYRLHAEPEQVDTLLLKGVDAQAEADRRLALWGTPRTVFALRGYAELLTLQLGQAVTLHGDRWGLTAGKNGIVIGLQLDWIAGRAEVEVLI